jgi:hypothetical protein
MAFFHVQSGRTALRVDDGDDASLLVRDVGEPIISDEVDIDANETVLERRNETESVGHRTGGSIMTLASTLSISAGDMICCGMYSAGVSS